MADGVIDPAKIVRTALQDAASVSGLIEAPKEGSRPGHAGRRHGFLIQPFSTKLKKERASRKTRSSCYTNLVQRDDICVACLKKTKQLVWLRCQKIF